MFPPLFRTLACACLIPLGCALPGPTWADDVDRDGRDDANTLVDLNGDGVDDTHALPTTDGITATLIVHRTQPWAYTGMADAREWSPAAFDILRSTIAWYSDAPTLGETRILLFTYNGEVSPPVDPMEEDGLALYQQLLQLGCPLTVKAQWEIEELPQSYMQGFDFIIYWNSYGYDPRRALGSGVPFLTQSYMHFDEMGLATLQGISHERRTAVCVHDNYGPTASLPAGPLQLGRTMWVFGVTPTVYGRPLISNECGSFPDSLDIVRFAVTPDAVEPFGSVTMDWEVVGADAVSIDGFGSVATYGSLVTQPERDRTYLLRAHRGPIEETAQASVTVQGQGVLPGYVGLSWSPGEWPGSAPAVLPLAPFDFYALAVEPPGGIGGYELSVSYPPCVTIVERAFEPPSGGLDTGAGDDNFIVATGGSCLSGLVVPLVRYRAMALNAACLAAGPSLDLGPATPSSFVPPSPGYQSCGEPSQLQRWMVAGALPIQSDPHAWVSISSFEADQSVLEFVGTGRLSWEVVNAESVHIEPGGHDHLPATGTLVIDPTATTEYTLTASNAYTSASRSLTVARIPFDIASFTADRDLVPPLADVTLAWNVAGIAYVWLEGFGPVERVGSRVTQPERSRSYLLSAQNGEFTRTASVSVSAPTDGVSEGLVAVSWAPDRAPGVPPLLVPNSPFDFYVVAIAPIGGIELYQFAVDVPACLYVQSRTSLPQPGGVDIGAGADNWVVATGGICMSGPIVTLVHYRAMSSTADCLQPGVMVDLSGSSPSGLVPATPGHVPCGGGAVRRFAVAPPLRMDPRGGMADPAILGFSVVPGTLLPGQTATLSWSTLDADHVSIQPGDHLELPESGTLVVNPPQTTTYTLTASNERGTRASTATANRVQFLIRSFQAADYSLALGDSTVLSWQVDGVADVTIDPLGPVVQSGALVVRPDRTTRYSLLAHSGSESGWAFVTVYVGPAGPALGTFRLSWSEDTFPGTRPSIEPFSPFDFWVHAFAPEGGVFAYEFATSLPPGMLISGGRQLFPPGATDFGVGDDNFIVGTGGMCMQGSLVPLVRYRGALLLQPVVQGASILLGPASPTSFPQTGTPGYLTCLEGSELRPAPAGPPLSLTGDGGGEIPAVVVVANAVGSSGGVVLEWRVQPVAPVTCVRVLRGAGSGEARQVVELAGERASANGSWLDETALAGTEYRYRVLVTLEGGTVGSQELRARRAADSVPVTHTQLLAVAPNPFNPRADIQFALASAAECALDIFNAAGQRVRSARLGVLPMGAHSWNWDGTDGAGVAVGSGVYRVRLVAGREVSVLSATLVR